MDNYVTGFMFNLELTKVALIKKSRPLWQAGKLNGIGGKWENYESHPLQAMVREFKEETGVSTTYESWRQFCILNFTRGMVYFSESKGDLSQLESVTDEPIVIRDVDTFTFYNIIPNLRWLIPMALEQPVTAKAWI